MTKLADILREYHNEFISTYGHRIHTVHHRAMNQILTCVIRQPVVKYTASALIVSMMVCIILLVDTAFVRPVSIWLTVTG
jgi:hypothetical protein